MIDRLIGWMGGCRWMLGEMAEWAGKLYTHTNTPTKILHTSFLGNLDPNAHPYPNTRPLQLLLRMGWRIVRGGDMPLQLLGSHTGSLLKICAANTATRTRCAGHHAGANHCRKHDRS